MYFITSESARINYGRNLTLLIRDTLHLICLLHFLPIIYFLQIQELYPLPLTYRLLLTVYLAIIWPVSRASI